MPNGGRQLEEGEVGGEEGLGEGQREGGRGYEVMG